MKDKKFKVACFQTNSSDLVDKNIDMLSKMFACSKKKSFDLICLPECVSVFSDKKKKIEFYSYYYHQKFLKFISAQSKKLSCFILVGSVPCKKKNGKFLNRSYIFDPKGKILDYYDKINLFDVVLNKVETYQESKNFDPGKKIKVCNLPWGNLGMSICYDLRFPIMYKKMAQKRADFFSIPAAFTHTTGKAHWHTLIRTRAIENGCFVFAPAQSGIHDNGRKTYGHSLIVDPWGNILSEASKDISIISAKIDLRLVKDARQKIPSMSYYK